MLRLLQKPVFRMAVGSAVIAAIVMVIKYCAYLVTGSIALLSDAAESVVNIVTALVACWAVAVSLKPADSGHPFGHHKAEYFSSILEGILIVFAAFFIFHESYQVLWSPRKIEMPLQGMVIGVGASLVNLVWAWLLSRSGHLWCSQALIASARHLFTDVLSSVGVLAGFGLVCVTGWTIFDPLLAIGVAVSILFQGWRVVRESVDGLMDRAASDEVESRIRETVSETAIGALEVHDLKTRAAGAAIFVEFHMVVPGSMTVSESHAICDRVEQALISCIPGVRVLIHTEPEERAKKRGIPVL